MTTTEIDEQVKTTETPRGATGGARHLADVIDDLEKRFDELRSRLYVIRVERTENATAMSAVEPSPIRCELAAGLFEHADRIRSLALRVAELTDELDL